MHLPTLKPILQKNNWFKQLPEDVIDQLVSLCRPKHLAPGQCLHAKNDPADGLYCVLLGRIRISNISHDGKESVLTWLEPGSWFGEISLFDGLPRTHDAHAEESTELMMLPAAAFSELLASRADLYPHFMRLLCQRIRLTFSLIDESSVLSLKGQLARRLLLLAQSFGQQDADSLLLSVSVSQESLALMLHTSRQTVNKLLQELKQKNIIHLHYGKIKIIDINRLTKLTQM